MLLAPQRRLPRFRDGSGKPRILASIKGSKVKELLRIPPTVTVALCCRDSGFKLPNVISKAVRNVWTFLGLGFCGH